MKRFQRYLEHNLSKSVELDGESHTFISAYQHADGTRLMALMDLTRTTKLDWWIFTDQHVHIWVKFRTAYESIHVQSMAARVSTSILPYVREAERNQLQLQLREPELAFCTSCYHMRTENEVLRARLEDLTGASPTIDLDRTLIRAWFTENYHANGFGRGYPRKQMRKDLNEYLAEAYGYKTEIYSTSEIWRWFVAEVIQDHSSQYRGFRVWKKDV
jgi:hypothetical protein